MRADMVSRHGHALPHLTLIRRGDHFAAVIELTDDQDYPIWLYFDDVEMELPDPPRRRPAQKPFRAHIDMLA